MSHHKELVASISCPSCTPRGAFVLSLWIPFDIWSRIAMHIVSLYDLKSFRSVCRVALLAVSFLQAPREEQICSTFHAASFVIPPELELKVLTVHAVPPKSESLIFILENEIELGMDIAWLRGNRLKRAALGLEAVPASTVSNIRFSPDGRHIALLITLANEELVQEDVDPLHRLRGWETMHTTESRVFDISYDPCEDCTVQIVDLVADEKGMPSDLLIHTFSHVFVPEYGFDMVWRNLESSTLELAFAAMLHSAAGAATYLVRWRTFERPEESNYIFMGCIEGASTELMHDKHQAMLTLDTTRCTSRIEISREANCIFFDTLSKCGVLRFDQVEDADSSRVTRADLPNSTALERRRSPSSSPVEKASRKSGREVSRLRTRGALRELNVGNPSGSRSPVRECEDVCRVSCMSPDGTLLCSVLSVNRLPKEKSIQARHLEMRSSISGKLIYRRTVPRPVCRSSTVPNARLPFDKSCEVAQNTLSFSDDSELVVLWDTRVASAGVVVCKGLPVILQARSGLVVQDFRDLQSRRTYENMQMSPDGRVLYATRLLNNNEEVFVDAIDVLTGTILKTVFIGETLEPPERFLGESAYVLDDDLFLSVSRGWVDSLWKTTRGSLGCGWKASPRSDNGIHNDRNHEDQSS